MRYAKECEHIILNDDIEKAARELVGLVKNYRQYHRH
jgi:guanylate kinase